MSSVTLNSGSGGASLGTDQVAGTPNIDYQVVKIGYSVAGSAPTQVSASAPLPVDGSSVTQPVSAASLPLPTGAATAAKQPALGTAGTASSDVISIQGIASMTPIQVGDNSGSLTVDNAGTFAVQAAQSGTWNITNISGTVSLPTGAATAAKQPALGTAGTASADVITVQGIASMTALKVDGSAVAQPVTDNSGSLTVDAPVGTPVFVRLSDGSAAISTLPVSLASVPSHNVTNAGTFATQAAQSGTWTVQPGNTANTTAWLVNDAPAASGGLSFSSFVSAASNNKTAVKASAGQLYIISVQNLASTPVYLKVFDKTSANVTAGTTACDYQFMIPGNTAGAGVVLNIDKGIAHANGITIMLTAGIATTDNTSVSANNQVVTIGYK
jgi:hypothetical protein